MDTISENVLPDDSDNEAVKELQIYELGTKTRSFPRLKINIIKVDKEDKEFTTAPVIVNLTASLVGFSLGEVSPFFIYKYSISDFITKISQFIPLVTDKTLFNAITELNKIWKNGNAIEDISRIKEFKKYLQRGSLFTNKLFEFYSTNLKKLVFFQEELFKEVCNLFLLDKSKMDNSKNASNPIGNATSTGAFDNLMELDSIIMKNIKDLTDLLLFNLTIGNSRLKSSETPNEFNFYQCRNAINIANAADKYSTDFSESLKLFKQANESGYFFTLLEVVKPGTSYKEIDETSVDLYGGFNIFLKFELKEVKKIEPFTGINCPDRKNTIKHFYLKLTSKKQSPIKKGGRTSRNYLKSLTRRIRLKPTLHV